MKHKIVQYTDSISYGGAEKSLFNLLKGLDSKIWEPILVYHANSGISTFIDNVKKLNIQTIELPAIETLSKFKLIELTIKCLRSINPSIFHAHLPWTLRCSDGIISSYLAGYKNIVITQHGYENTNISSSRKLDIQLIYERLISILVKRYIAVSYGQVKLLKKAVLSADKVRVVRNGVYIEDFPNNTIKNLSEFLKLDRNKFRIILTVARLDKLKGHTYLLDAVNKIPDALFLFAGEGPERKSLEERAREQNILDRVLFLGYREDIPELLNACDLFVLPSLQEGLPLTVLEAMASEKPVIATQIAGINEIITNGENGLLVSPRDGDALAEAIGTLLTNPNLSRDLAVSGKSLVSREFTAKRMVREVTDIYAELLKM